MTYNSGYNNVKVEIISVSHDKPFSLFWDWYRETWLNLHDVEYDPQNLDHRNACLAVLNRQALPTPMEMINFDIRITGLSRVALAQITRGRVGHCYNVQSQMPQHIHHAATVPLNIAMHPKFGDRARQIQDEIVELYNEMYDEGIPPQDCRYMILHGQQTTLRWGVNYSALVGWFSMRCENGLTDELNYVGRLIKRALINLTKNEIQVGSGWPELISKLDCIGAAQQKCMNVDDVFGNTGRFPSAHAMIPSAINSERPCRYRFDNSAFYHELLQMDDSLLFEGEREMIDDWKTIGFDARLRKIDGK